MMRRVTMLGIAALILLHPTDARAGLFGGGSTPDDTEVDRGANRSYERAPHDEEAPRSPHGTRVREVGRRSRADDDDAAPPRVTERDSSRAPRDEEMPRSTRRRAEATQEDGLERESGGYDKKMQDLHRQLEEAEQSENPRKIKAIKWMIDKEEGRHESALSTASKAPPARAAHKSAPSYEPPDRADRGEDRDDHDAPPRAASRDDDRAPRGRTDDDAPQRPARFARATRSDEPEVSNPLKERSRRRGEDADTRSHGRTDRDEDDQDGPASSRKATESRYSNAARIARAEGGIRRY